MIIEGNKLTAEEGMILTNGETYSDCVYLGIYDSPNNWHEIIISEVPDETEENPTNLLEEYAQAARILLGMEQ